MITKKQNSYLAKLIEEYAESCISLDSKDRDSVMKKRRAKTRLYTYLDSKLTGDNDGD